MNWAARPFSPAISDCAIRWSRSCPTPDGALRAPVERGSAIGYCRVANPVERQLVIPTSSAAVRSLALAVFGMGALPALAPAFAQGANVTALSNRPEPAGP